MTKPSQGRLLIVDDEAELSSALCDALAGQNYDTLGVASGREGLKALEAGGFDVLLSDLMMPGMDGLQLLREALALDPQLVGIIMTGQGTVQTAVEAMKLGAFDYVLKPFKLQAMLPVLARAMQVRRLRMENVRLRQWVERLSYESPRYTLVGSGPAMRRVRALVEKVAPTDATVLVRGPSGTGKELVARALHRNSPRRDRALVTVNCAALQESLLESELFGHEKGAFTGATQAKRGLVEVAEGGTLFIDEIAEMAPALQAKLLRVLEDGHYRRVGGTREFHADVRVVAATNKPLELEQREGRFREDLFYRLNVVTVALPPLRERPEDVPELVGHLLTTRQLGAVRSRVSPEAMAVLLRYDWPGNVRELANVLERAQILAEGHLITADDLPENLVPVPPAAGAAGGDLLELRPEFRECECADPPAAADAPGGDPLPLREAERRHVLQALRRGNGNKAQAAKALGISRRALYRLIAKHGLEGPAGDETPADGALPTGP
ncbi:MAG: sigma-54 dependent transcriptional regulator [Gemmataceae bacterium]|nr:sigma-54 dependent transcriptional regulator [Gemmataceae bacterium]